MFNFQAYNTKRHEQYPQLYKLIEEALGYIMSLRGVIRVTNLK